ncbi:hormone-sensitive lipase isoform X2 [Diorhabda carinulata]|uniref:hormone-sensitive lipase isoform X2 n=1 Tax=Diorhabda carinulata TaxID=1163345 RepID=UPI0025A23AE2|nr:hormone-sensitive lipase isoform X2 [Diorhabda carinulata]
MNISNLSQDEVNVVENCENHAPANASTSHTERDLKIDILKDICDNNANFFSKDNTENGQRLYLSFLAIVDSVEKAKPKILAIETDMHYFDFDENTPGNGYRSFLLVLDLAIQMAIDCSEKVLQKRDSTFFRKTYLTKDIESCSHLMNSLDSCLTQLQTIMSLCTDGNLFVGEDYPLDELFTQYGEINQHCFYGRHLGFQYCDSIRNVLQFIALSMTLFSEVYYNQGSMISKATNSVISSTKFFIDPEQRAKRIVNISQHAEVDFCKAFWFLAEAELMNQLPSIVSPSVAISKVIQIPPEPIVIENLDGESYEVPVPSSYIGRKSVQVRLISHKIREGMLGTKGKSPMDPPSNALLIHCHGGGFVAQSSKSHDGYLRHWAKKLDVPILCIDYSLAPEAPFPRALEEILFAYCWAKKHHEFLGTTGEIIIGAGDSAGANLLLSSTLKCIESNIPTMSGLFVAYVPTLVHYIPSPARLLCMMDPLLPFGFLMKCLKAYACPDPHLQQTFSNNNNKDTESFEEITESDIMELQAHKSPTSENSDTLTYESLESNEVNVSDSVSSHKSGPLMNEILERYAKEQQLSVDGNKDTTKASTSQSLSNASNSFQSKVANFVCSLRNSFSKYLGERTASDAEKLLDLDTSPQINFVDRFCFEVPKDPFLSPIFATDEDLRKFPPTKVLSVEMDPCLDDCIMFAKRLKNVGNDVSLDILRGLPHGFLNFSLFSKEAHEGSNVCVRRIEELLKQRRQNQTIL